MLFEHGTGVDLSRTCRERGRGIVDLDRSKHFTRVPPEPRETWRKRERTAEQIRRTER